MRTRVAVIGGGQSCEHEVSLASAAAVAGGARPGGVRRRRADHRPRRRVARRRAATDRAGRRGATCCAPARSPSRSLHGPRGEDGTLAALCDLAGVPYVGSGVGAGALAMDKWATKLVARGLGIARAPRRAAHRRPPRAAYVFTHPVVVKPVAAGSSHGVTLVRHRRRSSAARSTRPSRSTTGSWSRTSSSAARSTSPCSAAPTAAGSWRPRSRSWPTGSSTTTTKYDGSADFRVPAALDGRRARRRSRTRRWRCTTPSAAPASPGSTSS